MTPKKIGLTSEYQDFDYGIMATELLKTTK